MNKKFPKLIMAALLMATAVVGIYGCKKDAAAIPPARAFFPGGANATYQVSAPNVVYKIPVGVTNVEQSDRIVNIAVSSPTGATSGTHYNAPASITIPAGKAVDTLVVSAVYDQYLAGRKDVLEITVSGDGVAAAGFSTKVTLNVIGPCFEGDIVISELEGEYLNSFDVTFGYGPYGTEVKSIVSAGPTSALVTIGNIYDFGWNDLEFTIDWADPANPVLSFVAQATGYDAGNENSAYAGEEIWIAPPTGGTPMGTYSYCNQTFTINYRLCIPSLGGCFGGYVTTTMAR